MRYKDREEFCKRLGQEEVERMKIIRNLLLERFIKLKNRVGEFKMENPPEEVKMAKELVTLCEKYHGQNFSKLNQLNDQKAEELYEIVSDFMWELEKIQKDSTIGKEPGE